MCKTQISRITRLTACFHAWRKTRHNGILSNSPPNMVSFLIAKGLLKAGEIDTFLEGRK